MIFSPPRTTLLVALSSLLLSACVSMPEQTDYEQQTTQELTQRSEWQSQNSDQAQQQSSLHDLLSSPELDALIDAALKHNPNLQQTWLSLKIREAELSQTQAGTLPQLDLGFNNDHSEQNGNRYHTDLTLSWQIDLWNQLDNQVTAAELDVAEQTLLYQSARDTLAAEVMTAWLNLTALQHSTEIEQQRLTTLEKNEQFILQRYRNGIGSLEDLDSARSAVEQSRATIEANQHSYRQQQRELTLLTGDLTQIDFNEPHRYPEVKLAFAELPEQSLSRRPDLQAAYHAIKAAEYRTEIAYQDLLPSLNLSASLAQTASSPRASLLTSPLWSLLTELSMPLFHGGEIKAAAKQAELETASSFQAYRDTLLTAVSEVEQALDLEQSLATQQQHIQQALDKELNNLKQYEQSYRQGLVDILDLLNIQQQTYDLQSQLDNLIYQRLANRITLGLALGLGVNA